MDLIISEILQQIFFHYASTYPQDCSNSVIIADRAQVSQILHPQLQVRTQVQLTTFLVLPLLNFQNESKHLSFTYPFKHCRSYSVIFYKVRQDILTQQMYEDWKLVVYPGSPWNDYHLFFIEDQSQNVKPPQAVGSVETSNDFLFQFAHRTRKIIKSIFIHSLDQIFTLASNAGHLVEIELPAGNSSSQADFIARIFKPDYEGAPLRSLVCAVCGQSMDFTGRPRDAWHSFFSGTTLEIAGKVNATVDFVVMYSLPQEKRTEEEDWDSWQLPLLDGSAALNTIGRDNTFGAKSYYSTRPLIYETCVFITAKAKVARSTQFLTALVMPLRFQIWVAVGCTVFVLVLVLEMTFYFTTGRNFEKIEENSGRFMKYVREQLGTTRKFRQDGATLSMGADYGILVHVQFILAALFKPPIDQGGSDRLEKSVQERPAVRNVVRVLLGLWLLVVIVLGSAYKSEFTSNVVIPNHIEPPGTFRDLANSKYGLSAVAWKGNLESNFQTLQSDYSDILLRGVTEFDYFEDSCYLSIFEGDNACIGYSILFDLIAIRHLIDTQGRALYVRSKESLFPMAMNFAISPYYGSIVPQSSFVMRTLECTGIIQLWRKYHVGYYTLLGKQRAQETKETYPIFGGPIEEEPEDYTAILIQVCTVGFIAAFLMLLCELCFSRFQTALVRLDV